MLVEFNGKTYRVDFKYGIGNRTGKKYLNNISHKPIKTHCIISEKIDRGQYNIISEGQVTRTKNDLFRKDIGRRLSLSKATKSIKNHPDFENLPQGDRKSFQKTIWRQYYLTHPQEIPNKQTVI